MAGCAGAGGDAAACCGAVELVARPTNTAPVLVGADDVDFGPWDSYRLAALAAPAAPALGLPNVVAWNLEIVAEAVDPDLVTSLTYLSLLEWPTGGAVGNSFVGHVGPIPTDGRPVRLDLQPRCRYFALRLHRAGADDATIGLSVMARPHQGPEPREAATSVGCRRTQGVSLGGVAAGSTSWLGGVFYTGQHTDDLVQADVRAGDVVHRAGSPLVDFYFRAGAASNGALVQVVGCEDATFAAPKLVAQVQVAALGEYSSASQLATVPAAGGAASPLGTIRSPFPWVSARLVNGSTIQGGSAWLALTVGGP